MYLSPTIYIVQSCHGYEVFSQTQTLYDNIVLTHPLSSDNKATDLLIHRHEISKCEI